MASELHKFPGSPQWAQRDTQHNALGWTTQVSEWTDPGAPRHWTKYLNHDPFGRVRRIRPPDGSAHDVTVAYTGDRVVNRTVKIGTARGAGSGTITETSTPRPR